MLDSNPLSEPSPPATSSDRGGASLSRLNAQAPEFVPRFSPSPPSGLVHVYPQSPNFRSQYPHHLHHHHQNQNQNHHPHRTRGTQYFDPKHHREYAADVADLVPPPPPEAAVVLKNGLTEEAAQKIINQVEYYFSDINLATTDHLMKFINKEAEGYVPVSVVASFKKIKAVISSNSHLASILRGSTKLVVSEDGKKVKRQHPITELDLEELQSRIIIAENLPEDHCHQNLMKIFSAVGSVKTIRTCQPQPMNNGATSGSRPGKADGMLFSNKLHAFVEYESVELAEKAVAELNDEANWRSGLRVRLFVKNSGKSAQPLKGKKSEHERSEGNNGEEDGALLPSPMSEKKHIEDHSQQINGQLQMSREHIGQGEEHLNDKEGILKKGRGRGKGKGRGVRAQSQYHHHHHYHNNNNNNNNNQQHRIGTPPSSSFDQSPSMISKQPPGPRMPDGTRGFSLGRGKPLLAVNNNNIV